MNACRPHPWFRRWWQLSCLALGLAAPLQAQSWLRESVQDPTVVTGGDGRTTSGNLDGSGISGTVTFRGGVEYTDNLRLERSGRSGLALVIGANGGLNMPLTVNNELYLQVAVERKVYVSGDHGDASFMSVAPGTNLGMDVFVGRAKLRGFINLMMQEDPVESVVVNETDRFGRLNADAGVQLDWDLNRVILQGLAMAGRQWHTHGDGSLDAWRYAYSLRPYFPQGAGGGWGLNAAWSEVDYLRQIQNDLDGFSFGLFAQQMITRNMRVLGEVGWQEFDFAETGSILDQDDFHGIYGSLRLDHQLRRTFRYSVLVGEDVNEGIGTNYYRVTRVLFAPQWAFAKQTHLDVTLSHEWIDESSAIGESATRLGATARLQRVLSSRMNGSLEWRYVRKDSSIQTRSYERNQVSLILEYAP